MHHEIEIHLTKDRMPLPFQTVLVSGGIACWTGTGWVSQSGMTTNRIIPWPVTWWTPLIVREFEEPSNAEATADL